MVQLEHTGEKKEIWELGIGNAAARAGAPGHWNQDRTRTTSTKPEPEPVLGPATPSGWDWGASAHQEGFVTFPPLDNAKVLLEFWETK